MRILLSFSCHARVALLVFIVFRLLSILGFDRFSLRLTDNALFLLLLLLTSFSYLSFVLMKDRC